MKELKKYQEKAIVQLLTLSKMYFDLEGNETIVLQAPTGSGKTFTMARYMLELVQDSDLDLCFLWVSIGRGELHKQSLKSVKREVDETLSCTLLEQEFFGSRSEINQNEVVFVNWEKIRNKDKDTGEFKNTVMKDKETINFPEVLKNTHALGRKIVLIIDESHAGATTGRAKEIRDEIIIPELTIEMSATPVLDDRNTKVEIRPTEVIEEEMIKKEIIINQDIEKIVDDEMDSEKLILESAYQKREELVRKYREQDTNVNPLVLIQIPNSTAGDLKKESTIKFLEEKGITRENGKLAVWLDGDTIDKNSDELLPLDGRIEYLIFKMAIDTGWDCPRAQVLVKFRETNSIVFEIQTVGRILRMPEAHHYEDEELNRAFVYTNIQSIAIKKEVYNPNIIKSLCAKRRSEYTPTPLRSYYRNRVDYGDITRSFFTTYEHIFCEHFGIKQISENELTNYYDNTEALRNKGVVTEYGKNDGIMGNVRIESTDVDKDIKFDPMEALVKVNISPVDLEIKYDKLVSDNLSGFAPKRSIPTVKQAILYTFKKYLGLESARGGIMYIQNMVVSNYDIFAGILSEATEKYKPVHEMEVSAKSDEEFNDEWEIEPTKNYNTETNVEIKSKLSLYQPLFIELKAGKVDQLEVDFMNYLDLHEDKIEWFWKNGAEHMKTNFGIQKADKSTFQPDFIIKFKDGSIGIFDTKAGKGFNENDNEVKSNALYKYIYEERNKGHNLFGGLVIKDGEKFKYFESTPYIPFNENPDEWKLFDELLK